jgi:hypothetical protein
MRVRYPLESSRSSDVNFNVLKGCKRPKAAKHFSLDIQAQAWLAQLNLMIRNHIANITLQGREV